MKTATTTLVLLLTTLAAASASLAAARPSRPRHRHAGSAAGLQGRLELQCGRRHRCAAGRRAWKPGGTFEPEDKPVALFGGTVTSADVNVAEGEKSLFVYLNGVDSKRPAWSVTEVNEHANTEEPSYVKRIDKRHTLHVIAGDDYEGYSAAMKCQISR